jgi:autotransporter strand-loop-strand O-heptosyltransferase
MDHDNRILCHFLDGATLEINGLLKASYLVKFINQDKRKVEYETTINKNEWARSNLQYFINWKIQVFQGNHLLFEHTYNPAGKNIFISFESSSLGDTIAYMPYTLEFKNKHHCNVIVCTHFNHLFESVYPELNFVTPGETANNLYAIYRLGWFYDSHKEPVPPNAMPLQKAACNILGLRYRELKPRIKYSGESPQTGRLVTIATHSTAGCKFWTGQGWQEVIDYLKEKGYTVINVSKEINEFKNCLHLECDPTFQTTIDLIHQSRFFIGLSSGLSWLAWAIGTPVVMISNFTESWHEFECRRITNTAVCHGCWNSHLYSFDKGDWNWCPLHQGTERQFECMKTITSEMVINSLIPLL